MFLFYDRVAIAATDPLLMYITCLFEFGDDSNRSAFRYADSGRDVSHPNFRVACQADDYVAMVAQKRPPERLPLLISGVGSGGFAALFRWLFVGHVRVFSSIR